MEDFESMSLGTSKLLARVRSKVREHERMWMGTIGKASQQIITLDFINGLASVFNNEVQSVEWLFLGQKSVYEKDHDKIERRKGSEPGGWAREPKVQA